MRKTNFFNSRRLKHGTLATVMTIVFIAAIVFVNIIATILLEKFPLNIDLTMDQSYAMAEDSIKFLKTVDQEVTIWFVGSETDLANGSYMGNSFYDAQALNTLKLCTQHNSKIHLDFVDLSKNPQLATKYQDAQVSNGSIIVESDLRYKVMQYSDMFDLNYDNYYTTYEVEIEGSNVESELISAIMYVTEEEPAEIVLLTNNSPTDISGLKTLLQKNNYSFTEVNLLTEDIPSDAKLVMIAAPATDYTTAQVEKLEVYLNNAGKFGKKLVYIASYEQGDLPNLEGYLASDWGIQVEKGMLYETDSANQYMSPYYGLQSLTGDMFTDEMESTGEPVFAPGARPLTLTFETSGATKTTSVIKSSETSIIQPPDADENWKPDAATAKSYVIAAESTRTKYEEETNDELTSHVVVFGTPDFFLEDFLTWDSVLNGEFSIAMFNELSGKEENAFNIVPKYENTGTIEATTATANVILVIFVFLVPPITLITGLLIWIKRRHR